MFVQIVVLYSRRAKLAKEPAFVEPKILKSVSPVALGHFLSFQCTSQLNDMTLYFYEQMNNYLDIFDSLGSQVDPHVVSRCLVFSLDP
jgi:hypothetical protein